MRRNDSNEKDNREVPKVNSLLGVGFDTPKDEEIRMTIGKDFALVGGSGPTHESMQETVCKVNENLERRGKSIRETTPEEIHDVFQEVVESLNHGKNQF